MIRCFLSFAILLTAISFSASAREGDWCKSKEVMFSDRMVCHARVISWVEFTHQGHHEDIFNKNKQTFESFARMRLRNDLSVLKHDIVKSEDEIGRFAFQEKEAKEKIGLKCDLWWAGENSYPVVQHVECQLYGYGDYEGLGPHKITVEFLAYSNSSSLVDFTKDIIRDAIESIAIDFFEDKDMTF